MFGACAEHRGKRQESRQWNAIHHSLLHARTHVRTRPLTCSYARALHAPARRSPRSEIKKVEYDAWNVNIMELKQVLNP